MQIIPLKGKEMEFALPELAKLRIAVFKEWPYLYSGTLEYEANYLRKFSAAEDSFMVVAKDGDKIIGAATASPLLGHADAFAEPFRKHGYNPAKVFYFGESVLMPEYRGRGIGNRFFEEREKHARSCGGFEVASFCAVFRDPADPRKPPTYKPLDGLWNKHGFFKADGLTTSFKWKEDTNEEVQHTMQFWIKKL